MKKVVISVSGGMDSVVLLHYIKKVLNKDPYVLSFYYKQKHGERELECAKYQTKQLDIDHKIVDISSINEFIAKGALSGNEAVPHEHYTSENQKVTIVPNRNMILLSIATGYAVKIGADVVYYAAHSNDKTTYTDCRKEFVKALDSAIYLGNLWTPVELEAPFVDKSKADIVKIGLDLKVDFQQTYSCYEGKERPCLECGTCVERIEAFHKNSVKDPQLTDEEWDKGLTNLKRYGKL